MQIVLREELLNDEDDIAQVCIVLLQLFDLMHRGDGQGAALQCLELLGHDVLLLRHHHPLPHHTHRIHLVVTIIVVDVHGRHVWHVRLTIQSVHTHLATWLRTRAALRIVSQVEVRRLILRVLLV